MEDAAVRGAMGLYYCFGFAIAAMAAVLVAKDAQKRGMSGIGWGLGVFLLCIVFLPLYLIVRKPLTQAAPVRPVATQPTPPPRPAVAATPGFCPACGFRLVPGSRFCSHCGVEVNGA